MIDKWYSIASVKSDGAELLLIKAKLYGLSVHARLKYLCRLQGKNMVKKAMFK